MMKSAQIGRITTICLLLMAAAPKVGAQDVVATSFDQLRMLARLGDTVTVTDTSGHEFKGQLADLSLVSVALTKNHRTFVENDIRTIRRHDHANLATGAKWGLGVGAGSGFALAYGVCGLERSNSCGGVVLAGALVYGGLGAAVGVGISALIPTRRLIYVQPHSSAGRLTVSPLLTRERRGVSLSFGF
jgi:hypothetical protein